jgi:hypothetical protein
MGSIKEIAADFSLPLDGRVGVEVKAITLLS